MIPILMYHQIGQPPPVGTPYGDLVVHPACFLQHMLALHRLGYRGVSVREALQALDGRPAERLIGITFDDGYRNVLQHALPVLQQLGFSATNYFVAGQIGGSNRWDHSNGIPSEPLMTASEARAWDEAGMEVGSHTVDHIYLPKLELDAARHQIERSRFVLEEIVGRPVSSFSYPYGGYTSELCTIVQEAGYDSATTTQTGFASPDNDPYVLPRVMVSGHMRLPQFLALIEGRNPSRACAEPQALDAVDDGT